MADKRRVIRAGRTFLGGSFRPAAVVIEDGRIADVVGVRDRVIAARTVLVPDDAVLLPGLVDSHVHVNEPGRTEWEGFRSATLAAAAGGVTTIVDMPLNSLPPTTTAEALAIKKAAAAPSAYVDIGFWGGAVPENLGALAPLHEAGVFGFKCFLSPSGVDEFPHLIRAQLLRGDGGGRGARLAPHRARRGPGAARATTGALGRGYEAFLASRPAGERGIGDRRGDRRGPAHRRPRAHPAPERRALAARDPGREGRRCRADGRDVPALPDDRRPRTSPTARASSSAARRSARPRNRDLLWEGVVDGTIDAIVSDHSPSTVDLKRSGGGDFGLAWGGIAGLQVGLSAVWTEARSRGIPLETILPLFTTGPASVAGLTGAGVIAPGAPAHLTVFGVDDPFADRRGRSCCTRTRSPPTTTGCSAAGSAARGCTAGRCTTSPRAAPARPRASAASRAASAALRVRRPDTRRRCSWMGACRPTSRSCSRASATFPATTTCARRPRRCCGDGCRARRMPRPSASVRVSP